MKRERLKTLQGVPKAHKPNNICGIRPVIHNVFTTIEHSIEGKTITGIPSGFSSLAKLISSFHAGELIIIGGRPSAGKTTLGLNIARHIGLKMKKPVVFFSLEMPKEQVALRLLCAEARLDLNMVRNGFIKKEDWSKLTDAAARLSMAQIFIADSPSLTVKQMIDKAKKFKKRARRIRPFGNRLYSTYKQRQYW